VTMLGRGKAKASLKRRGESRKGCFEGKIGKEAQRGRGEVSSAHEEVGGNT